MKDIDKSLIKEFLLNVYKIETNNFDCKILNETNILKIVCLDYYFTISVKISDISIWLRKYKIEKIYGKIKTA